METNIALDRYKNTVFIKICGLQVFDKTSFENRIISSEMSLCKGFCSFCISKPVGSLPFCFLRFFEADLPFLKTVLLQKPGFLVG